MTSCADVMYCWVVLAGWSSNMPRRWVFWGLALRWLLVLTSDNYPIQINVRRSAYTIDLNVKEGHEGHRALMEMEPAVGFKSLQKLTRALQGGGPGSTPAAPTVTVAQQNELTAKRKNRAMSLAVQPGQQILMNAFMMYMSGSQLNIFSISVTSMAILSPLTGIFGIDRHFGALQDVDLTMPKLIFIFFNLVWLGVGLYKMSSMRLLPTTSADFTHKIVWKEMMEATSIPPDNTIL